MHDVQVIQLASFYVCVYMEMHIDMAILKFVICNKHREEAVPLW